MSEQPTDSPELTNHPKNEQQQKKKQSIAWRLTKSVLRILVVAYVGLGVVLFFIQSRVIYQPSSEMLGTPTMRGMKYEDVSLKTSDGLTLNAWLVPGGTNRPVVLFFHGNGGNISGRLESISIFHQLGLSVFIIDYRGYGLSEGKPSEDGTRLDALAAWDYLVTERKIDPQRIIIFGRSLGAGVAGQLAREHQPAALILESAATSVPDLASDLYPYLPVRWFCRFSYDTAEALESIKCPVLIVHSADDEMIPFSHGQALHEAAGEPKELLKIHGSHNSGMLESVNAYTSGLQSFLSRHVMRAGGGRPGPHQPESSAR